MSGKAIDGRSVDERLCAAVVEIEKSMRERRTVVGARDMTALVRCSLMAHEISMSKAAELMGLRVFEMRALAMLWTKGHVGMATHRCKECGALWRLHQPDSGAAPGSPLCTGSWQLLSETAGICCDNAGMGDQIEALAATTPEAP